MIQVYRKSARRWLFMSTRDGRLPLLSVRPSPSQPKNATALRLVPRYITWWQRHIGVSNLPKVVTQLCPGDNWTHDLLIASPTPYRCAMLIPLHFTVLETFAYWYYQRHLKTWRPIFASRPTTTRSTLDALCNALEHVCCCCSAASTTTTSQVSKTFRVDAVCLKLLDITDHVFTTVTVHLQPDNSKNSTLLIS